MRRLAFLAAEIVVIALGFAAAAAASKYIWSSGYQHGAQTAVNAAYAKGYHQGSNDTLATCTPWGKWGDRSVVICRRVVK